MKYMVLCVFLMIEAAADLRRKSLWLPGLLLGILTGLLWSVAQGEIRLALSGLLPGGVLCGISLLSGGDPGLGDGLVLGMIGAFSGILQAISSFVTALFLLLPLSLYYLLICRQRRKELPFVPFLLGGFICQWVLTYTIGG